MLGGDHTVAMPDITGLAEHFGYGRISVVHFDAHADTGDIQFGSLYGHGLPMRRVIESGAVRGDRFLQIGLRGYWPEPPELLWMAERGMRGYEMAEIQRRGLDEVITEALAIAVDDTDGVYLSVDIDVVDPGLAPGTGTPEPGGLTGRELLDAVRRIGRDVPPGRSWRSSRWRRRTTRPTSPRCWPTGLCWRRCRVSPGGGPTPPSGTRWDESHTADGGSGAGAPITVPTSVALPTSEAGPRPAPPRVGADGSADRATTSARCRTRSSHRTVITRVGGAARG